MAIMIPDAISPDIKSNAEKKIFEWFKKAPGTDDWIILHSLGISSHQRFIHGEIDFLVLAPKLGMFALEVKGGRVKRQLGKWQFINKYGDVTEKIRGPFDQAWEGIYSVKSSLNVKLDDAHSYLKNIIFGIGVMFPDIEFESVGIDEESWQVYDVNDGKDVKNYIERLAKGALETLSRLGDEISPKAIPTKEDILYLSELLRGDFDYDMPFKIKQKYAEAEFLTLTSEQARCIDQLSSNPRILVSGTAGTGKTLLAIEAVKKFACNGEKVALFCYNKFLGEWLEKYFADLPQEQRPEYVGTFHRYMEKILADSETKNYLISNVHTKANYFETELPEEICRQFSENGCGHRFDRIIVDEAQDLITDSYLNVMDRLIEDGLSNGRWIMFGDFSEQSIYLENMTEENFLKKIGKIAFFALFRLTKNCRNTKKICIAIENIVGVHEETAFEDSMDSPYVDFRVYADKQDQREKLLNLISELKEKQVLNRDIIILSPHKYEDSVVGTLDKNIIKRYSVGDSGSIRFCSLQGFKGLESSTVIITDIESYKDEKLIYVGLSRARFDLHVFETEKAAEERNALFIKRRFTDVR